MSVRFKFRSSVNFDSVDLDSRTSISVRDLKSKIVEHKNLKICQDFDLVLSDADTGEEYVDEDFLVLSGSSVIIKRVPAGAGGRSAPSVLPQIDLSKNLGKLKQNDFIDASKSSHVNVDVENFDDFGIDFYPAPETSLLDLDTDDDDKVNCTTNDKEQIAVPRCSETPIVRPQNLESSDLSQGITRACVFEGDALELKLSPKLEEHKKLDGLVDASFSAMPKADIPSELRCSLCNTIFKEAVMIPCCQHSFCDKCIHLVLVEKGKCPKCTSAKCRVEDLLPNVSLRQAIEHFLESQMLMSGSDNILPNNAPDGESGIQAKEFSCAVSIRQRDPVTPHSPSATGKGSNQVMTESAYDSMFRSGRPAAGSSSHIIHLDAGKRSVTSSQRINHLRNGERDAFAFPANFTSVSEGLRSGAEYEGENQSSNFHPSFMQEEVKKKKGQWVNHSDVVGSLAVTNKYRKGDRTCFMCGSPDHFIRDCPAASNQYPILPTGDAVFQGGMPAYGPPYWHGASLPHMRPFTNVYANPGMMPFDASIVTVNPFAVPSYMSSMYGGLPVPYGVMRMGGLASQMPTGAEHPLTRGEFMEFQGSDQRRRFLNEHLERGKARDGDSSNEGYRYNEPQRSYDYEPQLDREIYGSYSEDSDLRRAQKKHPHGQRPNPDAHCVDQRPEMGSHSAAGRERRVQHFDGSSSEIQDLSDNSGRPSKDGRHKHHHHRTSKKQSERRVEYASDSSRRNHHQSQKETAIDRKRFEADSKRHSGMHHSHTDSGLEPSSSGDRKRQQREKESTHSSRHIRHKGKSTDDRLHHERWEMVDGSDEDRRQAYHHHHHHKRKRNH